MAGDERVCSMRRRSVAACRDRPYCVTNARTMASGRSAGVYAGEPGKDKLMSAIIPSAQVAVDELSHRSEPLFLLPQRVRAALEQGVMCSQIQIQIQIQILLWNVPIPMGLNQLALKSDLLFHG